MSTSRDAVVGLGVTLDNSYNHLQTATTLGARIDRIRALSYCNSTKKLGY